MIRNRMNELGYTYRSLAEDTGINYVTLWQMINRKNKSINAGYLIRVCRVLNLNITEVLNEWESLTR